MRAVELVLDYSVYPRHQLDPANVASLRQAIEAGEILPPVAVDGRTLRVADGFHRRQAVLAVNGDGAMIAVEFVDYASDADLLLDAVRRNARHGVRLTPYDRARCLELGSKLDIDPTLMASALSLSKNAAEGLRLTKTAIAPDGKVVPIKRTLRHLAGERLSEPQMVGNELASGMSVAFYARQLLNALEHDLVNWDDEATVAALNDLTARLMALRPVG